ncbi:MAG: hypothetical protein QW835_00455, partial [Candidatus Hadarchaeum sp.]
DGLYSEEIFGRLGSEERKHTFAYIDLRNHRIIHPEVYSSVLSVLDPDVAKYLAGKTSYKIVDGRLVKDPEGETGVASFINNLKNIDFDYFAAKGKQREVEFLKKNFDRITISKQIVLPAGVRDIVTDPLTKKVFSSEINRFYEMMIRQSLVDLPEAPQFLQRTALSINNWIRDRLKGKRGIIKGGMLGKRVDYSARLVLTPDPDIMVGDIGLPWQTVLKLFEPFTIHHLLKRKDLMDLLKLMGVDEVPEIKRFLTKINEDVDICSPVLKDALRELAKEISKNRFVLYKRDPVENRDSWLSARVHVLDDGYMLKLNPVELPRNGADCDGDTIAVFAVFSEEATEEAMKMNPRYSKGVWLTNVPSYGCPYRIIHDAASAVYIATKE